MKTLQERAAIAARQIVTDASTRLGASLNAMIPAPMANGTRIHSDVEAYWASIIADAFASPREPHEAAAPLGTVYKIQARPFEPPAPGMPENWIETYETVATTSPERALELFAERFKRPIEEIAPLFRAVEKR